MIDVCSLSTSAILGLALTYYKSFFPPRIPWSHPICCCSRNAWKVNWPMSSVGPGDVPGHSTCPLVDHWETPDSSMSMTNGHVGFLRIKARALVNAPLQISEALGQQSTCTRVSWKCWHLGHLWSIPCSIRWCWDIVANRANSSLVMLQVSMCVNEIKNF